MPAPDGTLMKVTELFSVPKLLSDMCIRQGLSIFLAPDVTPVEQETEKRGEGASWRRNTEMTFTVVNCSNLANNSTKRASFL